MWGIYPNAHALSDPERFDSGDETVTDSPDFGLLLLIS